MAIRIKVAQSAKERQQVYQLRYKVYSAIGHFKGAHGDMVMDSFDALPSVASIIAYDGDTPVGTLRVNRDSAVQLPADKAFDFSEYRASVCAKAEQQGHSAPLFVSSGMLAIDDKWRNRRDVFRALFKVGCDVAHAWGATHIIATVNQTTVAIYRRLGFDILAQDQWHEEAQDYFCAVGCELEKLYQWAFSSLTDQRELVESFSGCFEYRLVSVGTILFEEGDSGNEAYLINSGMVKVIRRKQDSDELLKLATLGPGEMFGDMTLIDDAGRSATVIVAANAELLVLDRQTFWQKAQQDPVYLKSLLKILSNRLRETDRRTLVYAYGEHQQKLHFFLGRIFREATPSLKNPQTKIARITVEEFAFTAGTSVAQADEYLAQLEQQGKLTRGNKGITFIGDFT